jgi:spermidine/putrescine transport system substrate-binding protein
MSDHQLPEPPPGIARRRFLGLGAAVVAGGLLAACGDDDDGGSSSSAAAPSSSAAPTSAAEPATSAAASSAEATSAASEPASSEAASSEAASTEASQPARSADDEPGNLTIYDYQGYEVPDLWTAYAAKYPGKDPKWSFLPSDAEALSKINAGFKSDVLHPCSAFIQDYVSTGEFQPWDPSLISNFADLNPALVEAGVVDGQQYVIPEDWGFISILYDKDVVEPDGEPSWNLLFDKRYDQKISWYDNGFDMMIIGGYAVGAADPWNMTDEEIDAVKAKFMEAKKYVRTFWSAQADMEADFKAGNIALTYAWPSSWVLMQKEGKNVEYMDPKEGRLAFLCGFSLFKDTKNYVHAHDYVDAWSSPESALWLINNYAYGHANTKVDLTKVDPNLVTAFGLKDPATIAEPKTHVLRSSPQRIPMAKAWEEIKAA